MTNSAAASIGAAFGATVALVAAYTLFGAQHGMVSSADPFRPSAYYVVGEKRFDYFRRSSELNCWGGHTLDGRCISVTYVSPPNRVRFHYDPLRNYDPARIAKNYAPKRDYIQVYYNPMPCVGTEVRASHRCVSREVAP